MRKWLIYILFSLYVIACAGFVGYQDGIHYPMIRIVYPDGREARFVYSGVSWLCGDDLYIRGRQWWAVPSGRPVDITIVHPDYNKRKDDEHYKEYYAQDPILKVLTSKGLLLKEQIVNYPLLAPKKTCANGHGGDDHGRSG